MFKKIIEALNRIGESIHGCGLDVNVDTNPPVMFIVEDSERKVLSECYLPSVTCAETMAIRLKSANGFEVAGVKYKYGTVRVNFTDVIEYHMIAYKDNKSQNK